MLAEKAVLVVLISFMVLLSFWQVVLRQVFSTGILWADTLLRHLVLWAGFLGAALATVEGKHFALEAVTPKEGRMGSAMRLTAHASAVLVSAFLVRASWGFLMEERSAGSVLFAAGGVEVPAWVFSAAVPVGFSLVLLHMLVRIAADLGGRKK